MKKMLLVVDPQIDFINGSLPVAGAAEAMDALAEYVKTYGDEYIVRIVTSDWHPYHHSSFVEEGGQWPRHCVQHSVGAAIWQSLLIALNESRGGFTLLYKGDRVEKDEYSIMQNERSASVIIKLLMALEIEQVDVCGLAGNVCVLNTAKDLCAISAGMKVNVLEEFSPSLDDGSALREFTNSIR